MRLGYARGARINQQLDRLEDYGIDELFSDAAQEHDIIDQPESEFCSLLDYGQPGDDVVITSLEVISRDLSRLLLFLDELEALELGLLVLNLPELSLGEYRQFLTWNQRNERLMYPRLLKLSQEKKRNKDSYSIFSRDPEAKQLYREVIWSLIGKEKLRKIAKQKGVPMETVYRIKQEMEKVKLVLLFISCFFLAIFSMRLAESFSDNVLIQLAICVITTLIILYNTLADSDEF